MYMYYTRDSSPLRASMMQKPHLTSFIGYKAGMTHVLRDVIRPGSRIDKKEAVEPVTLIEAPNMVVVGIVGYAPLPNGLRSVGTVWAEHLTEEVKRRFYKNWYKSKQRAFTKYVKKNYAKDVKGAPIKAALDKLRESATVIRVIAHSKIGDVQLRQKKVRTRLVCM